MSSRHQKKLLHYKVNREALKNPLLLSEVRKQS